LIIKIFFFEHFHPEEIKKLIEETNKIDQSKKEWSFSFNCPKKI